MPEMGQLGRPLIVAGAVLTVVGLALFYAGRIPWIGRLPGDIVVERKGFTFYFPLATSVLLSLLLSLVLWLIGRK